jgi:hypothetical protein
MCNQKQTQSKFVVPFRNVPFGKKIENNGQKNGSTLPTAKKTTQQKTRFLAISHVPSTLI